MRFQILKRGLIGSLCLLLLAGCGGKRETEIPSVTEDPNTEQEILALEDETPELTVWSVYWDCEDDWDVLKEQGQKLHAVSLFAAYFEDGVLKIPEPVERMQGKISRSEKTKELGTYLSVVNDVVKGGKTTQKDTEILQTLLGTEESREAHATELVKIAVEGGYGGIEIDYEKIRSDLGLWENFLKFENVLIEKAEQEGLGIRIILEPSTPADQLSFPDGAEYVVMCYNLYGNGTDPGPKADFAFLEEMVRKFQGLPNVSYALANGGYDWESGSKKAVQRRASEIEALIRETGSTAERDEDSGALSVSCRIDGKDHTIWYADETTLAMWAEKLRELSGTDVKISLWRM